LTVIVTAIFGSRRDGSGDRDRHGDLRIAPRRLRIVDKAISQILASVNAVGNIADGVAHQPLRIVHQVLVGAVHRVAAVAAHEVEEALRADLRRGDLSIHVADNQVGDADVVADYVPDRVVGSALIDDLDRLELQPLGVGVDRIDDAAASRRMRADVEVMRRGDREADQVATVKHWHAERHVGAVRGAAIGIVVHDHVAGTEYLAPRLESLADAADIAGDRTRLQRRAHLALAQLPPLGVGQRRAEILGFADDARIAHAHELVAHLDRDVLQRPLNDCAGDRIDARRRLLPAVGAVNIVHRASPATLRMRLPAASLVAVQPGGMTVVESFCSTMAGPEKVSPTGRRWRR
jgi:hypothetical protein